MDKKKIEMRVKSTLIDEKRAVSSLSKSLGKDFYAAIDLLFKRKGKIILTGVGKSSFIAMKIAATLTSLGHGALFLNPVDALHGDSGIVQDGDVIIAISFSGGTTELIKLLRHLKSSFSISILAITGNKKSSLAQISTYVFPLFVKKEGCPIGLAPMASTTASLVMGDLIASALTSPDFFEKKHFAKFHPAGMLGLSLKKVEEVMTSGEGIPVIKETELFTNALMEITNKGFGVVAVVNKSGKLVGVITDGDVRRIVSKHFHFASLVIQKVMTKEPKYVHIDDTLKDALEYMEQHKITSLFVVDKHKKLKGVVHIHNIVGDTI